LRNHSLWLQVRFSHGAAQAALRWSVNPGGGDLAG
jgi:hypothetical protein